MSLILTGNTSNITIDSTSGITFPNNTLQASAGSILQVVNATLGTKTTITTTGGPSGLTDIGLSATITPKFATSKIMVFATVPGLLVYSGSPTNTGAYGWGIQICNSSNTILYDSQGDSGGALDYWAQTPGPAVSGYVINKQFLHSPATTSAYTYKIKAGVRNDSGVTSSVYINYDSSTSWKPYSSLTLMEVAG
jgi:hypothetical protein